MLACRMIGKEYGKMLIAFSSGLVLGLYPGIDETMPFIKNYLVNRCCLSPLVEKL